MATKVNIVATLSLPDDLVITPRVTAALSDLADIMLVQAEDGLYTTGNPDGDDAEHVADFEAMSVIVLGNVLDL